MCKAIDDMMMHAEQRGIERGIEEGVERGSRRCSHLQGMKSILDAFFWPNDMIAEVEPKLTSYRLQSAQKERRLKKPPGGFPTTEWSPDHVGSSHLEHIRGFTHPIDDGIMWCLLVSQSSSWS